MNKNLETMSNQVFDSYSEAFEYRAQNCNFNHNIKLYTWMKFEHNNWLTYAVIIAPADMVEIKNFLLKFDKDFTQYYDELCKEYTTGKFELRSHLINGFLRNGEI